MKINFSSLTLLLNNHYDLFDELIKQIQLYAGTQEYAVCCLCTKKSPYIRLLETCYLSCNQGQKEQISTRQKQKHNSLRQKNCPFSLVIKKTNGF